MARGPRREGKAEAKEEAFLQADSFGAAERTKHVKFRPHPGYPEEVFELTGPLYGSDDAPMRFFNTVAPW